MDEDKSQTISFEEFWKGFKSQAQALKQKALHQQLNEQLLFCHEKSTAIDSDEEDTENDEYSYSTMTPTSTTSDVGTPYGDTLTPLSYDMQSKMEKRASYRAKILGQDKKGHQRIPSLMGNKSWNQQDKNNIFRVMKRHLKKTKTKKRMNAPKMGRVLESEDDETEEEEIIEETVEKPEEEVKELLEKEE